MMSDPHGVAGPLLSAYLDGELDEAQHRLVESHVASCASCRQELAELGSADAALSSLAAVPQAPDLRRELRRRLRRQTARSGLQGGAVVLYVMVLHDLLLDLLLIWRTAYPLWFRLVRTLQRHPAAFRANRPLRRDAARRARLAGVRMAEWRGSTERECTSWLTSYATAITAHPPLHEVGAR